MNIYSYQPLYTSIDLYASDPSEFSITYYYTNPSHGELSGTAPNLVYLPNAGYFGLDSFSYYVVNDINLQSNISNVNIVVTSSIILSLLSTNNTTIDSTDIVYNLTNNLSYPTTVYLYRFNGNITPSNILNINNATLITTISLDSGEILQNYYTDISLNNNSYYTYVFYNGNTNGVSSILTNSFGVVQTTMAHTNGLEIASITQFPNILKTYNDPPFQIVDPSSNSTGTFSYTITDTNIATVSGNIITILNVGVTTIIATQAATDIYNSNTIRTTLTVLKDDPIIDLQDIYKIFGEPSFTMIDPSSNSNGTFNYDIDNPSVATIFPFGNIITLTGVGTAIITAYQSETNNYNSGQATALLTVITPVINNICFIAGSQINTDQGIINIENLSPINHTINGKKIITISKSTTLNKFLICFNKNSLGDNIPFNKTIMTASHRIYYNNEMIEAYKLIDSENIYKVDYNDQLLYNVLVEDCETMTVNNIICETLNPNNLIAKLYANCPPNQLKDAVQNINDTIKQKNINNSLKGMKFLKN